MLHAIKSLSHLIHKGEIIAKNRDEFGDIIAVRQDGYLMLKFNTLRENIKIIERSPNTPMAEYTKAMLMVPLLSGEMTVLVLGLGAGCLPRAINTLHPSCTMTVIEQRKALITTIEKNFGLPKKYTFTVINEHPNRYMIKRSTRKYDVIFSNIYTNFNMDTCQKDDMFLYECRSKLSEDGWLVMNFSETPAMNSTFIRTIKSLFDCVYQCNTGDGHSIIYAGFSPIRRSLLDIQTVKMENLLKTGFDSVKRKFMPLK